MFNVWESPQGVLVWQGEKQPSAKISTRALSSISKHSTDGNVQYCY
jgi:hypothetical protein